MQSKYFRLDRYISKKKLIKRKDIRLILAQQRVIVNGLIANSTQQVISPFCEVIFDDETLQNVKPIYLMMHKPIGVVSANTDDMHKTVFDLINQELYPNLHLVGRLDLNTSGLVILTNDGKWSKAISSPSHDIQKHYIAGLKENLSDDYIDAFSNGMYFPYEDVTTKPARLTIINKKTANVWLTEGKYHQIKRMFGRFRNQVLSLHRQSIGPISLCNNLEPSQYRELTKKEILLMNDHIYS